jgi:hypothetical protein
MAHRIRAPLAGDATTERPHPDGGPVAASLTDLFGREVHGEPLVHDDGKTGARLERVVVEGEPYVLKYLHVEEDWVMRATGDLTCRVVTAWRAGWLAHLPACLDHGIVAVARDDRHDGRGAVLVMRDLGEWLVPEGDDELPVAQHEGFLDHMAQLHAAYWDCDDAPELMPLSSRFVFFGPLLAETERTRGGTDVVPTQLVPAGWARFEQRAPRAAPIVASLLDDPSRLVAELTATPRTFVHGDWKAGNLGSHPDGRTILLDWALPGVAPACTDLAWYVCLNRARLPTTKERTFDTYREALERHGVDTGPWWDRQLALTLLGTLMLFGWEKALSEDAEAQEELAWWEERTLDGARLL